MESSLTPKLKVAWLWLLFFACASALAHPANDSLDMHRGIKLKFETSAEYLTPTHRDRSIQTVSANLLFGVQFFKKMPFSVYAGVTTTYAWGTIIQWNESFKEVTYRNNAFGIGPAFLLRWEPGIYKGFSISPDVSGGLIFYSNRFPHGGDIYNFMWRMGGAIHYHINNKFAVNIYARWMHVSNGQGLGDFNPSYEAWGVGAGFVQYFW
jgi:lipid A 3-O-deacylase